MKRFFNILGCISILIAENQSEAFYSAFQYRNIGPTRGGRVTAVTGAINTPTESAMNSTFFQDFPPSIDGTSTSVPKAASENVIGSS